jgi:hypothetical protein
MEGKVRDLEKGTRSTFAEVKESVSRVGTTLNGVNTTLAIINERMVTKDDCVGKQQSCLDKQTAKAAEFDVRLDAVELQQKTAQIKEDLTDPNFKVPTENGLTPERAKKWVGVAAAVMGLLGFTTISTCVSNTMGELRTTVQQTQTATAQGIKETRAELQQIRSNPPVQVTMPPPVVVSADAGITEAEKRYLERRRRYLRNTARRKVTARRRPRRSGPASQPHR